MSKTQDTTAEIQRTLECVVTTDHARDILNPASEAALRFQIDDRTIWITMGAVGLYTQVCQSGVVKSERYCNRGWITVTAREADDITVTAKPDFQQRSPPLPSGGESA